jgi:hypothetical protein
MVVRAKAITMTKFSWLDAAQRKAFWERWEKVKAMHEKWFWSGHVDIQLNKKNLEQEIKDLEDLSFAAFRAAKLLKKQLAEGSRDYESESYSG